ncbi:hypothetical protein [Mesorhizobium sp. KR1-2]|uniref:hypothetical protein n=1 Tax=Mesorhizobium sp. KR1-2 TaxID=3156609 RepID=UPI0032B4CA83
MRKYLSFHPEEQFSFTSEELDMLDALVTRVVGILDITDERERDEAAARILSLYTPGGRSFDEVVELAVRLHKQGSTPGGRRSDGPSPERIRTERQRRRLSKKKT